MSAYEYVKHIQYIYPYLWQSLEKPCTLASNSELRRWLGRGSVQINGQRPGPDDEVVLPVRELVLHPNGKRRTTLV